MKIDNLPWDSDLFGYPVGQTYIRMDTGFCEFEFMKLSKNLKLIYIFSDYEIPTKYLRLTPVDNKLYFRKNLRDFIPADEKDYCSPYENSQENAQSLKKLVFESGKYSRFKIDEGFKNREFERLYSEWMVKSIHSGHAYKILVYLNNGEIVGFISLEDNGSNTSSIGLFAVDYQFQGKGIGKRLISEGEKLANKKGYNEMLVSTQEQNKIATSFYVRNGYKAFRKLHVYHYWNMQ